MNKVVDHAVKVDLHIHSVFSQHKDGRKVSNNTIDKLDVLINKLNENNVNVCSITDHDLFSFDLYSKLKEEEGKGSIQKVLPGVEFSVEYEHNEEKAIIHVVTLFDDSDKEKIKKIENIINGKDNKPIYDLESAFSEKKFLDIMKSIDLDTIMIAHQKNSLTSGSVRKNDANSLGKSKFEEFLFTEYFEAFEFRNKDYEVFMNNYIIEEKAQELLRMITGSDCHDWEVYPHMITEDEKEDFVYTWLKCLPTFKGIVMAMTDYRRIKKNDSFFNPSENYVHEIDFTINGNKVNVPLSKGINVIIGENSIGKSLLLHELTDYVKEAGGLSKTLRTSYEQHMIDNNYSIETKVLQDSVYIFDMQGEIRKNFEEHKLKGKNFISRYFQENIDTTEYETIIDTEINNYCESLKRRKKYLDKLNTLTCLNLNIDLEHSEYLVLVDSLEQNLQIISNYDSLISTLKIITRNITDLSKYTLLENEDIKILNQINILLKKLIEKYLNEKCRNERNNSIINILKTVISAHLEKINELISDNQKNQTSFITSKNSIIKDVVELIELEKNVKDYEIKVDSIKIEPKYNNIYNYSFITKIGIKEINKEYIEKLILSIFIKGKGSLSANQLFKKDYNICNLIKNYPSEGGDVYEVIMQKVKEKYSKDLKNVNTINIGDEQDKFKELSQGFNTKIYFDIISHDRNSSGIYIVDQPEDNISQKAIKDYVLDRFKTMSYNRQIIMVTHNPQFIVNLDVDNVIYLGKDREGGFYVQSGALEYNEDYSILKIVADNIDGGIQTISKRWKRYEKGFNI